MFESVCPMKHNGSLAVAGSVSATTRKRKRVRLSAVLFVHVRRMSKVPTVELLAGSEVKSRTLFGGASVAAQVSSRKGAIEWEVPRLIGEDRFSGPGAPSRWPALSE